MLLSSTTIYKYELPLRERKIFIFGASTFFKKLYSYTNTGSAYILELEQIHVRKACQLRYAHFSGHKKRIFSSQKAQKA